MAHLSANNKYSNRGYLLTIKQDDGRYFAPNAALQLAYIHESRKDMDKARYYFEKVLEYKNYTYENSLRSKVRSALKNLDE